MDHNDTAQQKEDNGDSSKQTFFLNTEVEKSRRNPIAIRFEVLINRSCERPFDWYKDLELDKSYASKVRRGLLIPPKWLRIKIAQYFKTDSATIWEEKNERTD